MKDFPAGSRQRPSTSEPASRHAARRPGTVIRLAWATSFFTKLAGVATQLFALPIAYRTLGDTGFAAFSAVTASASIVSALNLGIGGSLVTPLATAAARGDRAREQDLFQAGMLPLFALSALGAATILPIVAALPLGLMLGRVAETAVPHLRMAMLIAVTGTLLTIPLSAADMLRQAYQEIHVTNIVTVGYNLVLAGALLLASGRSAPLAVFVAIFTVTPLLAKLLSGADLLANRPHLLRWSHRVTRADSIRVLTEGLRYVGASLSFLFTYQWPVYWIARTQSAFESATFALTVQFALLPISLTISLVLPLWSLTAEALAHADHDWLNSVRTKGRLALALLGCTSLVVTTIAGNSIIALWVHRPFHLSLLTRALVGAYVGLATWEYFHFTLALGMGRLREATAIVFQRSAILAILIPFLSRFGGAEAVWCALCISVLWTAYQLPRCCTTPPVTKHASCDG